MRPTSVLVILPVALVMNAMHRLSPAAFPDLPPNLSAELQRRGCQIPEPNRKARFNVIKGEFITAGQTDWAVLCVTKKNTELIVFPNSSEKQPTIVSAMLNTFTGWGIGTADESYMRFTTLGRNPSAIKHDGIRSTTEWGYPDEGALHCGAQSEIFYFDGNKWTDIVTLMVN